MDVGRCMEEKGGGRGLLLRVGRVLEGKGGGKGREGRESGRGSVVLLGGIDAPNTWHIRLKLAVDRFKCASI